MRRIPQILAAAAMLTVVGAGTASADGPFISQFHHISGVASTVPANGDVNPYGTAVVQAVGREARSGSRAGQQLQRPVEPAGHRHDDRADLAGRAANGVRTPDGRYAGRPLPGRSGADNGARGAPVWMGDRGQPANQQRHVRDGQGRVSDRDQQLRPGRGDHRGPAHQRPLGHDLARVQMARPSCS